MIQFLESAYYCEKYDGDVGRLFIHAVIPAEPHAGGAPPKHALLSVPVKPGKKADLEADVPYYALRLRDVRSTLFTRRGSIFPGAPIDDLTRVPATARFEIHNVQVYAVDDLLSWIRRVNRFCRNNPEYVRNLKWT
jgi:hypothetical protein